MENYATININYNNKKLCNNKHDILLHEIIGIGFINIKLSEVSQTPKNKLHYFIYIKYKTVQPNLLNRSQKSEYLYLGEA